MAAQIAPRFHVLAKPTGAVCNLDCSYCFFLDKERLYPGSGLAQMAQVDERLSPARVGRNEPCRCGSEKKFKRRHGAPHLSVVGKPN